MCSQVCYHPSAHCPFREASHDSTPRTLPFPPAHLRGDGERPSHRPACAQLERASAPISLPAMRWLENESHRLEDDSDSEDDVPQPNDCVAKGGTEEVKAATRPQWNCHPRAIVRNLWARGDSGRRKAH